MLGAGQILARVQPSLLGTSSALQPETVISAGILVGLGTRMANGCTSGHGVCGLPRRSLRSLAAVFTFMASGAITTYLVRTNPWLSSRVHAFANDQTDSFITVCLYAACTSVCALALGKYAFRLSWPAVKPADAGTTLIAGGICGVMFGLALGVAGMTQTSKVLSFLDFSNPAGWDPSLAAVMGGAVLVNLLSFQSISECALRPPCESGDCNGKALKDLMTMGNKGLNLKIDAKLIGGSVLFGVGWGLAGMCPGPVVVMLGAGALSAFLAFPSMAIGMAVHDLLF